MSSPKSAPILTSFGLPAIGGAPFQSPFRVQAVVGFRLSSSTLATTRPVACGASLTTTSSDDSTVCVDSPGAGGHRVVGHGCRPATWA